VFSAGKNLRALILHSGHALTIAERCDTMKSQRGGSIRTLKKLKNVVGALTLSNWKITARRTINIISCIEKQSWKKPKKEINKYAIFLPSFALKCLI
jgi:hypothetical protein